MKRRMRPFLLSVCTLLLASSATVLGAQQSDTTATRESLREADLALAHAVTLRGAAAFLESLEPDAAVLFPGQPILRGPLEARAAFVARYGTPSSYAWEPGHEVASTEGRFGCTIGLSRFTDASDTTHVERQGSYVTCWRRARDGAWRIAGHQRNEVVGGALAPAVSRPPHSATMSSDADTLAEVVQADASFASMSSDSGPGPAFARFAATDAMLLGSHDPPHGPAEIRAAFAEFPDSRVLLWEPTPYLGAASGGLGFTVGHAINKPREDSSGPEGHSKYLTVWRREADGHWAFILDLGSQRP